MTLTWKLLVVATLFLAGCRGVDQDRKTTPSAAGAEKAYTIKIKNFGDKGKTVTQKSVQKGNNSFTLTDAAGKVVKEEKDDEVKETVFAETVLEGGDQQPKKFQRVFEKARMTAKGESKDEPYSGRTILFELTDGKYVAKAEGEPALDAKVLANLSKKVNGSDMEAAILPKKPVKAGETWTLDPKALVKAFAGDVPVEGDQAEGEGKLAKVYDKGGKTWGIIEINIRLTTKGIPGIKLDKAPVMEMKMTLDTAIDGSSSAGRLTITGGMVVKGVLIEDNKLNAAISSRRTEDTERFAEK